MLRNMRAFLLLLPTLVLSLLISAPTIAAPQTGDGGDQPSASQDGGQEPAPRTFVYLAELPTKVRQAMLAGEHDEALRMLRDLLRNDEARADHWSYYLAVALRAADKKDDALKILDSFEANFPQSIWLRKARFLRADVLRDLKRLSEAEQIYEEEALRLRSPERQGELAQIYLNFARELSTPPDAGTPDNGNLDYGRAANLYGRVLDLGAPDYARAEAMFGMARCYEELKDWNQARVRFESFLKEFGNGQQAEVAGIRAFEGRYRLGRCIYHSGNQAGSRVYFENLIQLIESIDAPADEIEESDPLREQYEMWRQVQKEWPELTQKLLRLYEGKARFALAYSYQGNDLQNASQRVAHFRRFIEAVPEHELQGQARFMIAEAFMYSNQLEEAMAEFDAYQSWQTPAGTPQEVVEENERYRQKSLFLKGQCLQNLQKYPEAIAVFNQYVGKYPSGEQWAAAQREMLNAEYSIGEKHRQDGEWEKARTTWTEFLAAHPLDSRAKTIAFALGELYVEQARDQNEKNIRAWEDQSLAALYQKAIAEWDNLAKKYANTDEASKALYSIGRAYEMELLELEQSISYYRRCNFGSHSGSATRRLQQMTKQSLAIETERIWRSNETAKVKAHVRNTEKLTVRVYNLDLEAYFRKHLTHQRIGDLDLDLIAADEEFEVEVENYAKYKPISQEIELPVKGAGVWAVAVDDGERRATSLVVRSDIDIIVKSSRREIFVFAQDMVKGKPADDVEVLLAIPRNGQQGSTTLLKTLETSKDGVARLELDELSDSEGVRMLAQRDGSYASNGLTLSGLSLSDGLRGRGYVYTGRPAYRPGQLVHWRAILREADGDRYQFTPGATYQVSIKNPSGQIISKRELKLNEFGSLSDEYLLHRKAPLGPYTITCRSNDSAEYHGRFEVRDFQLQEVSMDVEFEQNVYYRGDIVKGKAIAAYYYGQPLRQSPVRLTLPNNRVLNTVTDDNGEVAFEIQTRDMVQSQGLRVHAMLVEEGVAGQASTYVATFGYSAAILVPQHTILAGNSFSIGVLASDASGKPVERKMKMEVLRREQDRRGRWHDIPVHDFEIETDENGRADQAMTADKGGQYVINLTGTDRFGNPVTQVTTLQIHGDEDSQRLRIIAKQTRLPVGSELKVELFNREEAGLALLTFEGESMLDYKVVKLVAGSNQLSFDMDHSLYPNFRLAAAMMQGNKFHTSAADFELLRRLTVKLTPAKAVVQPGESTSVGIEVLDQLGKPVQAEMSLAVVDQSIFDQFRSNVPRIDAFFAEDARRNIGFRTSSSCTFRYSGHTADISSAVLDEVTRYKQSQEWEKSKDELRGRLEGVYRGPGDTAPPAAGAPASPAFPPSTGRALEPSRNAFRLGQAGEEMEFAAGLELQEAFGEEQWNDAIGIGGGAGGKYGGRGGRGGGKRGGSASDAYFGLEGLGYLDAGLDFDDEEAMLRWANAGLAFWTPAVITDADGKATVEFTMPPRSTEWRLTARGTTKETLVGQAIAEVIARDDFFVQVQTPLTLTEGDRPEFRVRVQNFSEDFGPVDLQLRLSGDGFKQSLPGKVEFAEGELQKEFIFTLSSGIPNVNELTLELTADGQFQKESRFATQLKKLKVRPWGVAVADAHSGVLSSDARFTLKLPQGRNVNRQLEISFGSQLQSMIIDAALDRPLFYQRLYSRSLPNYSDVASDLIGVCAAIEWLNAHGEQANRDSYQRLWQRGEGLISHLSSSQAKDGGWDWSGSKRQASAAETSARAMHALGMAQEVGFAVAPETVRNGVNFLNQQFTATSQNQLERKAILSYALAMNDAGDFGALNRLHRLRNSLSPAALTYTGLALHKMNRQSMATEVAALLLPSVNAQGMCSVAGNQAWSRSSLETSAMAALLLQQTHSAEPKVKKLVDALLSRRPWHDGKGRGLAIAAVSQWLGKTQWKVDPFDVEVTINGHTVRMELGGDTHFTGVVEHDFDHERAEIELRVRGRGRPYFQAALTAINTSVAEKKADHFRITRYSFEAEAPIYKGKKVRTGFGVLNGRTRTQEWRNLVQNLPLGEMTRVDIQYYRDYDNKQPLEAVDFLTLTVPLPAGCTVMQGSVSGNVLYHEVRGNELMINIGQHRGTGRLGFTLVGVIPGDFKVLPCTIRSAYELDQYAYSAPQQLTVLPRGKQSADPYRATPDELYYMGIAMLEAGDADGAYQRLSKLYQDFGANLRDANLATAAGHLLFMAIDRDLAAEVVRYFEVLKEKNPALNVPFDKMLAVGQAYRQLEEYERALLVFRATIEETFGKDLKVAGALDQQQELHGALAVMERLWLEFPDLPVVVETYLALGDKILALAPQAHQHASLKKAELDRSKLTLAGVQLLNRFLALYPNDPMAAEAGLNLVSAFLELEEFKTSSNLSKEFAQRFTKPTFADAFRYTDAVSRWYLGDERQAMSILQGIADARYPKPNGGTTPSENRDLALYILAQIHHAKQDYSNAADYYTKVEEVFSDAAEILAGFRAKSIELDEVTSAAPGKRVELELRHRNVEEAELLVYAVDLMTLYLRERNLSQITSVNLAGIAPTLRKTVKLKPEMGMLEKKTKVKLDLRKPGAYLVICRGDELHTSGLALVSDIELEVREDPTSGRLRIQARDQSSHKFVRDVDVRVVGSAGGDFLSGKTDPRGLYIADGVLGLSTVIARYEREHYAFFRGEQALGQPQQDKQKDLKFQNKQLEAQDYFDNVIRFNDSNVQQRAQRLQENIDASRKGVRVEQTR